MCAPSLPASGSPHNVAHYRRSEFLVAVQGSTMSTQANGEYRVVVDPGRCENKQQCLEACPTDVFDMVKPRVSNLLIRLKIRVHGGVIAEPVREAQCIGCMACVTACPENAITVTSRTQAA